ncbi:MAG: hypothetical protein IKE01_05005 [Clostridia bacterium]|nr:hypothetical protein [Clostridia bacterium]
MDKKTKAIIISLVVIIVLIAGFLCYMFIFKSDNEENTNQVNMEQNIVNNVVENTVVENTVPENNVTENTKNETEPVKNDVVEQPAATEVQGDNSETQADNDEDKAIEIVKKDWGNTDGFAFRVEQINANGTYVISVRNQDSIALEWYTVNPTTGKFSK